ncbi:Heat shock protein [Drechslerella dactyloides]|uniref:Heat shock protein n=1 Tax=Drechslerella dactyloides TaxID=74499 RepID=A0AAD6IVQ6_DREDA|nr:Heat shock protein [Drechslerella dactyloides]
MEFAFNAHGLDTVNQAVRSYVKAEDDEVHRTFISERHRARMSQKRILAALAERGVQMTLSHLKRLYGIWGLSKKNLTMKRKLYVRNGIRKRQNNGKTAHVAKLRKSGRKLDQDEIQDIMAISPRHFEDVKPSPGDIEFLTPTPCAVTPAQLSTADVDMSDWTGDIEASKDDPEPGTMLNDTESVFENRIAHSVSQQPSKIDIDGNFGRSPITDDDGDCFDSGILHSDCADSETEKMIAGGNRRLPERPEFECTTDTVPYPEPHRAPKECSQFEHKSAPRPATGSPGQGNTVPPSGPERGCAPNPTPGTSRPMYSPQQQHAHPAFNQQPLNQQWTGQSQFQAGYSQQPLQPPQPPMSPPPMSPMSPGPAGYGNPYDQKVGFPPQPMMQQVPQQFQQYGAGFPAQQFPNTAVGFNGYHPQAAPGFMPSAAPAPGQVMQFQNFAGPAPGAAGRHKIVVGLDFGTTYSGLAFADTTPGEPQISVIQNWPSCGNSAISQVCTEIAYTAESGSQFSWGYDIQPSLTVLKWFKLFLEYPDEQIKEMCELPPGKTILDVTADFLGAVYRHAMEQLYLQRGRPVMEITQVDFVLTIPAVWNELACMRTRKAAERAGFTKNHTLNMCTEPEAAALYTLRSAECSANVGDKVIVCDAGGGTVDLISYNIRRIVPRLEVDEAVVGTGDTCGSTYIDQAFEDFFRIRMGEHYDLRVAQHQRVMRNFEEVKCGFRDREDQETYSVIVPGKNNIPEAGVVDGEFEISRAEMRALFDPVVDKVIGLIAEQVKQIHLVDRSPGNLKILLVGGFGQSPYLYKRVLEWAKPQGIDVLQPGDGGAAVVKGAVIRGLDLAIPPQAVGGAADPSRAVMVRKCRKHYGTLMIAHFIPGQHLEEDGFIDPLTGLKMARNQISWFVYKGAPITDDKKISQQFHRTFRKTTLWEDTLVVCEDDMPPPRLTPRVKILCKLTADMTRHSKRIFEVQYGWFRKIYTCAYRVDMTLRAGYMTFELVYKGISYGAVSVELQ